MVSRDGSGLRQLSTEEARSLDTPPAGRFDRAHKRLLVAEGGDVVVIDAATGARRPLMRTAAAETNPRWARNDTAVTFVRDGNLYLMSLDGSEGALFAQLTDVVSPETALGAIAAAAQAGGGGNRGGGRRRPRRRTRRARWRRSGHRH